MSRERLYLFDTTLRDGAQTNGVDFTLADKRVIAAMLIDALEKLAGGRGATKLTVDASDTASDFFRKRGYVAQQRNSITVNGEWLANTTMQKTLREGEK